MPQHSWPPLHLTQKTTRRTAEHPLTSGLADEPAAFFARNGAFETGRGFEGSVLLEYPKNGNLLLSGFILHPEKIQGEAASLEVRQGKGRIVITGFRPLWRGQPHNTFKLLFNALYAGGGEAPAAAGAALVEMRGKDSPQRTSRWATCASSSGWR